MTTTANNNERKEFVNKIGFSGSFYKFLGEDIKIGNQILYPGGYEFDYQIILDDECKNGHLTFSFTGSIKIKKGNGRYYTLISGAIGNIITYFKPELSMFEKLHLCNHLGQPTYIDNIRYHINEGKTVSPIQSEKESSLNDKERGETKQIERDNSMQPKETKPTMQYTDDMLELVSLDLDSMTYTVNGDIGTGKDIVSIVLYDKIGKIVVSCDDGEKIECQFDGESILQSVLKEM